MKKLDILVNNAAFQQHVSRFEDLTEEQFDRTMKTNLYGYFHMAQAAVPHIKPGSAIVNTGSVTGIEPSPYGRGPSTSAQEGEGARPAPNWRRLGLSAKPSP